MINAKIGKHEVEISDGMILLIISTILTIANPNNWWMLVVTLILTL
jgi:hypothetical protein